MVTSYEMFITYIDLIMLVIVLFFVSNMIEDAFKIRKYKRVSISNIQKSINNRILKMNNRR